MSASTEMYATLAVLAGVLVCCIWFAFSSDSKILQKARAAEQALSEAVGTWLGDLEAVLQGMGPPIAEFRSRGIDLMSRADAVRADVDKHAKDAFGFGGTTAQLERVAAQVDHCKLSVQQALDTNSTALAVLLSSDRPSVDVKDLADLRSRGLLSDEEFKAFTARFERTTGEKAKDVITGIQELHRQHKSGAIGEGNYKSSLWMMLDKLDRDLKG